MLAAVWCVCAYSPLGVLGALAGTQAEDPQPESLTTLERWFNPDYEFTKFEKDRSREWIQSYVDTISTRMLNVDQEVFQLRGDIDFRHLCNAIMNNDFSDIGSARLSVFALLYRFPVLCNHLLRYYPDQPFANLCLYKFFIGKKPGLPLSRAMLGPELHNFMDMIDNIPGDIKRLRYDSLIDLRGYCPDSFLSALAVHSDWKNEEIGREIVMLCKTMLTYSGYAPAYARKPLFIQLVEPLVKRLHRTRALGDETLCRSVLRTLIKIGVRTVKITRIKLLNAPILDPVVERRLITVLADEWSKDTGAGWSGLTALPRWCVKRRDLLRKYPDECFAPLCRLYLRFDPCPSSFVDLCRMLLRGEAGSNAANAMPIEICYVMLYVLSEDFKDAFSEADQQNIVRIIFGWLADDEALATVLCFDAMEENREELARYRRRLVCLSHERRESLLAWIKRHRASPEPKPKLWNATMSTKLFLLLMALEPL
ncbi:hypothetical protein PAPHI01_2582 [Pancytospora philotis]|nr:hypothetical protein PAPHI01_2582 [Pancytospora philotis]